MQLEAIGAKQKKCVGVVSFGGEHCTEHSTKLVHSEGVQSSLAKAHLKYRKLN